MKKYFYMIAMLALVVSMMTQEAKAQNVDMNTGLVVWEGSSVQDALNITAQDGFFYLIEYKDDLDFNNKEEYVAARGAYGVQAVISSVGMRMQIERSTSNVDLRNGQPQGTCYQLISRIENADHNSGYLGDRMGFDSDSESGKDIYLDRSSARVYWNNDQNNCNNFPNWVFNETTSYKYNVRFKGEQGSRRVAVKTYTIQNVETQQRTNWQYNGRYQPCYIRIVNGKLVTTFNANEASKFIIVSETDFDKAMRAVTWGEVDLGVFIQDATFGRDNKDGKYWVWETDGKGGAAAEDQNGKTLDGVNLTETADDPKIHWHQRNQDFMCNGIMLQENDGIYPSDVGSNVAGTETNKITHDQFRNRFGQYYSAEIYNEVNSLKQTLHCATIPNLVDGLYKFSAQALYYDDVDGLTNLDPETGKPVAYFYLKRVEYDDDGNIIEDKSFEEYMPIRAMNKENQDYQITPHSGISAGMYSTIMLKPTN